MTQVKQPNPTTPQAFDLLVIARFKEMIIESSSPSMFENYEKDIKQLIKTRKLNKFK